jgi:hypothetical protein
MATAKAHAERTLDGIVISVWGEDEILMVRFSKLVALA